VSKRFAQLRNAGLIANHSKGLPHSYGLNKSGYWRITEYGLERLLERFPDERVPANLVSRTQRASLLFFRHRDAMTACYMRLIASREADIEDMRARASLVDWRGEHEVVLTYSKLVGVRHEPKRIVPDATLSTAHTRYFLEIDRSTETHGRIQTILQRYTSAFRQPAFATQFPDALPPCVLYMTKSEGRAKNLQAHISELDLPFAAYAMHTPKATEFLNQAINSQEASTPHPAPNDLATALLGRIYDACLTHVAECPNDIQNSPLGPVLREVYDFLVPAEGAA